jgi:hypothetical protein
MPSQGRKSRRHLLSLITSEVKWLS